MTTVVNIKHDDYDILCTRGGRWGNPFVIGRDGTREEVIEKFKAWLPTQPNLLRQLILLKDKRLGCVCAPLPCHCDFYAELLDKPGK